MNHYLSYIIGIVLLFKVPALAAQTPLPNAHAHNDYLHRHPLKDALSCGFTSVEADIHWVKGQLFVGHLRPKKRQRFLLSKAYLAPLQVLAERHNGSIYPGYQGVFRLMIDVKTNAAPTYQALKKLMADYPALLNNPNFQVFISGNRDVAAIVADSDHYFGVDGRFSDLDKNIPAERMPVISESYRSHFTWDGKGLMPADELRKMQEWAEKVHQQGKLLRFWAIPDHPQAWTVLRAAGVDLINTDHLPELRDFLLEVK